MKTKTCKYLLKNLSSIVPQSRAPNWCAVLYEESKIVNGESAVVCVLVVFDCVCVMKK